MRQPISAGRQPGTPLRVFSGGDVATAGWLRSQANIASASAAVRCWKLSNGKAG